MAECIIRNVKIQMEIPVFLFMFGLIVSESVTTNLLIFRACYVTLGYNRSECELLGKNISNNVTENLEKLVQPTASVIGMTNLLVSSVSSVIWCLYAGPWCDRFGRKPIIIISLLGFSVYFAGLSVFSLLTEISPWFILAFSIPRVLTGGGTPFFMALFCYITDVTSDANRGLKMGIIEIVLIMGICLGNLSSSYVFAAIHYWGVFLISAISCLLAALFTIYLVPESLANVETEGKFREMFKMANIGDMVKCTFKKRPNYDRCGIIICLLILSGYIFIINGDGALQFLFFREKFDFSLETYTLFSAASNLCWVVLTFVTVYVLHKLLKIPETVLILMGLISMINGNLLLALADRRWELYAAAVSQSIGGLLSPMLRSLVSKMASNADIGKIFALITTSESLFGTAAPPLYTAIYNKTLKYNAGGYNFFSAGLYGCAVVMILGLIVVRTGKPKDIRYDELKDGDDGGSEVRTDGNENQPLEINS